MDPSAPRKDLGGLVKAPATAECPRAVQGRWSMQLPGGCLIAVALCNLNSACTEAVSSLCMPNSRLFVSVDSE